MEKAAHKKSVAAKHKKKPKLDRIASIKEGIAIAFENLYDPWEEKKRKYHARKKLEGQSTRKGGTREPLQVEHPVKIKVEKESDIVDVD